ncbi:unnamed protein product [Arabidopsis halleri]
MWKLEPIYRTTILLLWFTPQQIVVHQSHHHVLVKLFSP